MTSRALMGSRWLVGFLGADGRGRDDERDPFSVTHRMACPTPGAPRMPSRTRGSPMTLTGRTARQVRPRPHGTPGECGTPAADAPARRHDEAGGYGEAGGTARLGRTVPRRSLRTHPATRPTVRPALGEPGSDGAVASAEDLAGSAREDDAQRELSGPDESGRDQVVRGESGREECRGRMKVRGMSPGGMRTCGMSPGGMRTCGMSPGGMKSVGRVRPEESGRDEDLRDGPGG